jgi:membrane protease subunit HflC
LLLKDQNPVIITCYICWKINKPFKFFQAISSTEIATQKISDIINDKLGATLGNYLISNIINTNKNEVKLNEIENKLKMLVDKSTSENYGINVLDVGIKRINYPQIVAETVYNRMQAEREKEAKKYRAEGMEKASIIESNTDKFIAEIISEANKKAEIIKGEGDKKAIEIYSNAYSKEPDFFEFLKSLEVYGSVLNEKSTLILSTESDIFKYLNKTEK